MGEALATSRELGGRPLVAWTAHELAALLLERGRDADRATARALLDEAATLARELGMASVLERISTIQIASPAQPPAAVETFKLVRDGDVWHVRRAGEPFSLRDGKGVRYLARLIDEPRCELHVLDLADALEAVDGGDAGEHLDAQARDSYKTRLRDLEDNLAEAESRNDLGGIERATQEIEALQGELRRAIGLGGRARRAGAAVERARINVQRRLRTAIMQIAAHDPVLGRHLERSVRTGVYCAYEPD
jgi:hypothetical protein